MSDSPTRSIAPPTAAPRLAPAAEDSTRVFLVRHGATAWNADGRYQGRVDVPLCDAGRVQASALGDALRDVRLDAAYTSPLSRARETAWIALAGRGLRAVVVPALAELSYGTRQGQRRADWLEHAPTLVARWESAPWVVTFPGGESLAAVHRRAVPSWTQLVRAHQGQSVLVSAHGHVNRVLLLHALGLPRDMFWTLPQPNGACVVVDVGPTRTTAVALSAACGTPAGRALVEVA